MSSKRVKVLLVLLAILSLLILSACSGEDDIDELENWREDFFDVPSTDEIVTAYKIPIGILALLVLVVFVSTSSKIQDEGFINIFIPIILGIGVFLFILFPETAASVAERALPPEVNLEWVLNKLRVVDDAGLGNKVYKDWVTSTISTVPTSFTLSIGILFIANFFAMVGGILGKSLRGIVFFIASLIGVAAFMSLWVAFIYYMDRVWPGDASIVRKASMNIAFVVFTNFLFLVCFYALPVSAFIFYPKSWDLKNRLKQNKENTALIQSQDKSWDIASLGSVVGTVLGYMSGKSSQVKVEEETNTSSDWHNKPRQLLQLPPPYDDGDIVDGEYRVIPPSNDPGNHSGGSLNDTKDSDNTLNPNDTSNHEEGGFIPSSDILHIRNEPEHEDPATSDQPKDKKSKLFNTINMAAAADIIAAGATATGHPGVGAAAKVVGSTLSAYNFAKDKKEQDEDGRDPIITVSAGADLTRTVAEATNKPGLAKAAEIVGDIASTAAAVRESKEVS